MTLSNLKYCFEAYTVEYGERLEVLLFGVPYAVRSLY